MLNKRLPLMAVCLTAISLVFSGAVFAQTMTAKNAGVRTSIVTDAKAVAAFKKAYGVNVTPKSQTSSDSQAPAAVIFAGGFTPPWVDIMGYQGNNISFVQTPSGNANIGFQNPYSVNIGITVTRPVNVKYSLYTFKKTYPRPYNDGTNTPIAGTVQGFGECSHIVPLTTEADISANLDKIYEFPVQNETATGVRSFDWDGYTGAQFTGQAYPVRDCLYIAAHDDTGALLGLVVAPNSIQRYATMSTPGVNYTAGEKTVSAKLYLGYDDKKPISHITAAIMTEPCGWGAVTYDLINQGAAAMLMNINSRLPGDVVAYTELTSPTDRKSVV